MSIRQKSPHLGCRIASLTLFCGSLTSGLASADGGHLISVPTIDGPKKIRLMPFDKTRSRPARERRHIDYKQLGLKPAVDLRANQSRVKDQGDRGSCAYFAAGALVEHAYRAFFAYEAELNLSEEFMIYHGKAELGFSSSGDGSFVSENLKTIQQGGIMPESAMPYTENWFGEGLPCQEFRDQQDKAPMSCYSHHKPQPAQFNQLIPSPSFQLETKRFSGEVAEILALLDQGQPVTVAIPLNQDGWANPNEPVFYNQALDEACQNDSEDKCGGHAVLLVGYDLDQEVFRFKNSWGQSWGTEGYGLLTFDYIENWAWQGDFYHAAFTRFEPIDRLDQAVAYGVDQVQYQVTPGTDSSGEAGIWIDLTYNYKGPLGSYYYVSLFGQQKASDADSDSFEHITYVDGNEAQYVVDRFYQVVFNSQDLSRTDSNPLRLFLPTVHLNEAVTNGHDVALRLSIYSMTDEVKYNVLYRDMIPFQGP